MKNQMVLADLFIIKQVFFKEALDLLVFDPNHALQEESTEAGTKCFYSVDTLQQEIHAYRKDFVLVNLSDIAIKSKISTAYLNGLIDFSKHKIMGAQDFYFINNPDQTMRWFFPKAAKSTCFLSLYNSSGIKAMVYKSLVNCLYAFKLLNLISSGSFSVWSMEESRLAALNEKLDFDDFAVFTGTIGENRKIILALALANQCKYFLKIPTTAAASQLVKNEGRQLTYLSKMNFEFLEIPKGIKCAGALALTNVQPKQYEKTTRLQDQHFQALQEIYETSFQREKLDELSIWSTIQKGLAFFSNGNAVDNGLSLQKRQALQRLCEDHMANLNSAELLSVGIGHGDFTPWNMYLCSNKLHLYDWEMSQRDTPFLFDVFHYIFQKNILIDRKGKEEIAVDLEHARNHPIIRYMMEAYQIDWDLHYHLYLLSIVCYYLPKYSMQVRLHEQALRLVDTWIAALESIPVPTKATFG